MSDAVTGAAQLLAGCFAGVLSTHALRYPGYPFGSVVPTCLGQDGSPIILISNLAEHTHNLRADPRLSLLLLDHVGVSAEPEANRMDVQQLGRLTLLATAEPLGADAAWQARYFRCFPKARAYYEQLDFHGFRLHITAMRHIGGFARAGWLDPDRVCQELLLPGSMAEQEAVVLGQIEEQFQPLLRQWAQIGVQVAAQPKVCSIDRLGLNWRNGDQRGRWPFTQAIDSFDAVLSQLADQMNGLTQD